MNWTRALVFAAALAVPCAASADPVFTHKLDVGYSTATKFGTNDGVWSVGWDTLFSYDLPGPNLQIGGDYDHIAHGANDEWSGNASGFWRARWGTAGISVGYGDVSTGTANKSLTSYGAFSEWYMLSDLTVKAKGGAFDGGITGWYGGAGATYYPTTFISLSLTYNYSRVSGGRDHIIDAEAEYLISRKYPLSIAAGYEHVSAKTNDTDALMIHLRYRFGLQGSLVRQDRVGPVSWDGLAPLR
ncbi:MAG TPA: hypothetical protein VHL34_12660 [Rhizomicrobium sp.]|jgi:hypothetical protein|nr:hypothetical protein [Rhizomicrobium sp.]